MRTSTLALLSGIALTRAEFLAPAGGEVLEVDEELTVQWETEGLIEPLDISLVPAGGDAGADEAQEVASGIDNSGSVSFTPGVEAGDFELVLTDSEDNSVTSDTFSIGGARAARDSEDEAEGEANGGDAEDEEASNSPASQASDLNEVPGASDENDGEARGAISQEQGDNDSPAIEPAEDDEFEESDLVPEQGDGGVPTAVEPTEDDEVEGSDLVPEQGAGGVPTAVEPSDDDVLENEEVEVEDEDEDEDDEDDDEDEDADEVAGSLNPDTGGAVAGDAGDDDSNAGDAGSPPGSFIPLSSDQLSIFPTLSNDAEADAPAQPTEEAVDAVETSTVDRGIQTGPSGLSEAEPAEPTAVSSVSDGLAVSTSAADIGAEVTSAVVDGDVAQTDALELEPASSAAVTTDAALGLNPIDVPGTEATSTATDEASLDSIADTSTDAALASDVTQVSSAVDSSASDDSLASTSDPLSSASTVSASASDILQSASVDDALVSASDVAGVSSDTTAVDTEAQTATSDGALASLGDEVSATPTDEDDGLADSTAISTATGDVPTPVGSGDSDDSDSDDEDLESDDGDSDDEDLESDDGDSDGEDLDSDDEGLDSDGEDLDSDEDDPDTESGSDTPTTDLPSDASGVSGPTTFTTDIVSTGIITDGAASATVSQAGANAAEDTDSPGGSAGKMSGKSAMLGIAVLLGIWMF